MHKYNPLESGKIMQDTDKKEEEKETMSTGK